MGGLELIVAMILAAGITHAVENSGRQAGARWQESREQARQHSADRAEKRSQRAEQVKDRFGRARSTGPKDPLWWPYAAGYGLAGTAAAAGAGAMGLIKGARAGAQSGYRVGQEGAKKGWNLRDTWQQWRQRNPRDPLVLQQCERCGGWVLELHTTMYLGDVCDDCLPAEDADSSQADPHDQAGRCRSCNRQCPAFERDSAGWCRGCVDAANSARDGYGSSPCARCGRPVSHAHVGPRSTPQRIVCPSCSASEYTDELRDAEMRCGWCRKLTPLVELNADMWCPACRDAWKKAQAEDTDESRIYAQAERLDDEEPQQEKENRPMNALPGGSSVAVTGEGYTDTVQSLHALDKEMKDAQQAAADLTDSLTANSLDQQTLQQIADLADQIETAADQASQLARHVEQRHNPLAEATAAAGGSGNVATKSWYDQY